jgi:uncharacterized protein (TIGR02271 family)
MTEQRSPYSGRQVTDYMDDDYQLMDVDGDELGKIVEYNEEFVVVERGGGFLGLGEKDNLFVPRQEITREEGNDWYLSINKDDLEARGWSERPQGNATDGDSQSHGENGDLGRGASGSTRIRRYEEDLEVDKVSRQAGEVTVDKRVVEDTRTIEVPVRREELQVERHPVTADAATTGVGDDDAFRGDERITVPLMEEEVEVHKVARPVEEVEITKTTREDTRHVDDTVRREEFDIDDESTSRRGMARDI